MEVRQYLDNLRAYVEQRDFAGHDPYDALASPVVRRLCLGNKWLRIAWIQFLRRCPVNLRPLLLTRKEHNPKALGLFLEGYVRLHAIEPRAEYRQKIDRLIELLDRCKNTTCSGHGWGYNFDWQTPVFYVPRYIPTVVNSSFVGHALLDAYEVTGSQLALRLALPVGEFILKGLNRIPKKDTFCFSYTPLDYYAVHNANFLGASMLARLSRVSSHNDWEEAALTALAYGMKHQRPDGSWFFSEQEGSHWIDSFHTGFVLESLRRFLRLGLAEDYRAAYRRGVEFYAHAFFLPDGTPKYYHDKVYPLDIHCPAQAIVFFSECGPKGLELAEKVAAWTVRNLYDRRGFFYFRRGRLLVNRIPYMRWSQAWAFRGLTALMLAQSGADAV
ncbi:MAG TPA: hypothetical protein VNA25_12820 [Phycisphaerae bacterium]|nr:hypothetical protein [Phycisphaerae bacterium]